MSKRSLLVLTLLIVIPTLCYFLVNRLSEQAVNMPPHFYPDSVVNKVVRGKSVSDTVWHKIQNISLVNQLGDTVSLYDVGNKIIIADFFFTRCPSICPTLTRNMKGLQDALKGKDPRRLDTPFVHFLSFSVDPVRDSVPVLKKYSDRYGVNPDVWWLMTGPRDSIYNFALNELKLGLQDGEGVDSNFIHTNRFVLIDKNKVVRGYYNGLDTASMSKLAEDLTLLMLERDKNKKRKLF
jgi:protein SCO1